MKITILSVGDAFAIASTATASTVTLSFEGSVNFAIWENPFDPDVDNARVSTGDAFSISVTLDENPNFDTRETSKVRLGFQPTQITEYRYEVDQVSISLGDLVFDGVTADLVVENAIVESGIAGGRSQEATLQFSNDRFSKLAQLSLGRMSDDESEQPFDIDLASILENATMAGASGMFVLASSPEFFNVPGGRCNAPSTNGILCDIAGSYNSANMNGSITSDIISFGTAGTMDPADNSTTMSGGSSPITPSVVPLPASFGFLLAGVAGMAAASRRGKKRAA